MSLYTRQALDQIVGEALCDRELRATLLNGHRADVIALLGLPQQDEDFVLGISAGTLQEFAQKIHRWLDNGHGEKSLGGLQCEGGLCFSTGRGPAGGRNGDRTQNPR